MFIVYCKKCNHFSYMSKVSNYCKECKTPLMRVPVTMEEFSELSLNERYKLAYQLTNNQENS